MIFIILFIFVRTWVLRGLMSHVYTRRQIRRIHPGHSLCLHTHFQCSFYCWCYVFLLLRNTRWSSGCISAPSFLSFLTATSTASAHKRLHKMWCWFFKQTHYIPPPPFWNPRFKAEQKRRVLWVQSEPVVCLIWAEDAGSSLTKPPLNSNRYRTVASGARSSLWICCFCVSFMSWILSVWHESSGNCSSALSPIYQLKSLID